MMKNSVKIKLNSTPFHRQVRTVRLLLMFYKIIGLWTPPIPNVSDGKVLIFSGSPKLGIIYNISFAVAFIGSSIAVFPHKAQASYPGKSSLVENVDYLQGVLAVLVISANSLYYAFSQNRLVKIANKMLKIAKKFDGLEFSGHREPVFRRSIVLCIFNYSLALSFCVTSSVLYFKNRTIPNTCVFLAYLLDYVAVTFITSCITEYTLIVIFISAKFAEVDRCVKSMSKSIRTTFAPGHFDQDREVMFSSSILVRLTRIEDVSAQLLRISDKVNEFFSVPMLFVMTYVFVFLTIVIFYLVVLFISSIEYDYTNITAPFLFVIILTFPTAVLMFMITALKNKVAETARHVHKLLKYTDDQKLVSKLKLFSLQLLHEKPQFSACGFFDLDCSLLQGIIGAVTTYLIILIQFQVS